MRRKSERHIRQTRDVYVMNILCQTVRGEIRHQLLAKACVKHIGVELSDRRIIEYQHVICVYIQPVCRKVCRAGQYLYALAVRNASLDQHLAMTVTRISPSKQRSRFGILRLEHILEGVNSLFILSVMQGRIVEDYSQTALGF